MKANEIKALREADNIEAVIAMVDCRHFEHHAKDEAAHIQYHLMLQYNNRILDGMPEAAALNHAKVSVVHANGGTVAQQSEFWRNRRPPRDAQLKETTMNTMHVYTKAEDVAEAYYAAAWDDNIHSEGCYALAVDAAQNLGGIETSNTNDGNSSISFAPSRTFEFDDSSSVYIMCGGVYVIAPNEPY